MLFKALIDLTRKLLLAAVGPARVFAIEEARKHSWFLAYNTIGIFIDAVDIAGL